MCDGAATGHAAMIGDGAPPVGDPQDLDALLYPPPPLPYAPGRVRDYTLVATDRELEIASGVFFPAWTYNSTVPGPVVRATEDDRLRVRFVNAGVHPHTIHFHGTGDHWEYTDTVMQGQSTVDDAIVPFALDGPATLGRLRSSTIVVPYDWVEGEPLAIGVTSSTGIQTTHEVAAAVETPVSSARGFLGYAAIGALVGVVPVALGLMWLPSLRRVGARWLALVVGFMVHNITEGLGIAAPATRARVTVWQLAALALIAGAPAILGTWIGGYASNDVLAPLFFAIAAGAALHATGLLAG